MMASIRAVIWSSATLTSDFLENRNPISTGDITLYIRNYYVQVMINITVISYYVPRR